MCNPVSANRAIEDVDIVNKVTNLHNPLSPNNHKNEISIYIYHYLFKQPSDENKKKCSPRILVPQEMHGEQ